MRPPTFVTWLSVFFCSILPTFAQPQISIELFGNDQIQMTWPQTNDGYLIKRAERLSAPAVWGDVAEAVVVGDGTNAVVVGISATGEFFMLKIDKPDKVAAMGSQSNEVALLLGSPPNPGNKTLTITVKQIPSNGTVKKSDGTPVTALDVLTSGDLTGLVFVPDGSGGSSEFEYAIDYGGGFVSTGRVSLKIVSAAPDVLMWGSTPQTGAALFGSDGAAITVAGNLPAETFSDNPITPIGFVNGSFYFVLGGRIIGFDGEDYSIDHDQAAGGVMVGGRYYFSAFHGTDGRELGWTDFDGTAPFADIRPGSDSSFPGDLAVLDGQLYFMADDGGGAGRLWWKMNGDVPVPAVLPENAGLPLDATREIYYFRVWEKWGPGAGDYGGALWGFDGIKAARAVDTNPGGNNQVANILRPFGDGVVFRASDGTTVRNFYIRNTGGTLTSTPFDGPSVFSENTQIWKGLLYYGAGTRLWVFDGATATEVPNQPYPVTRQLYPVRQFEEFLTIAGSDGTFWVFDGVNFTQPSVPVELGGGNYYMTLSPDKVVNGTYYVELGGTSSTVHAAWDGGENVTILSDPFGNTGNALVYARFLDAAGDLIFVGTSGSSNADLEAYRHDGTDGTKLSGVNVNYLANPYDSIVFQGKLYFSADVSGVESKLWTFDGTDVAPASGTDAGPTLRINSSLFEYKGKIYFYGEGGVNGFGTWSFDGTDYAEMDFNGANFKLLGDLLVFTAPDPGTGSRNELWSWDGIGDPVLRSVHPTPTQIRYSNPRELTVVGESLFFSANDSASSFDFQLWEFNGTGVPTKHVVNPSGLGGVSDLTAFNGKIYFGGASGQFSSSNRQLFSFDAVDGVRMIGSWTDFRPSNLVVFDGRIYFQGYDNGVVKKTWSHDGDPSHTVSGFFDTPVMLYNLGSTLIMESTAAKTLWSYDGTTVTEIWSGGVSQAKALGDWLYFRSNGMLEGSGDSGQELWGTDGLSAPILIADVNPLPEAPRIRNIISNELAVDGNGLGLQGDVFDDILVSSPGNDTMTGGGGADRFAFGATWGNDKVTDFDDGVDVMDISATGLQFGDLTVTQAGSDTVIDDGAGNTITLNGINASDISGEDFFFGG